MDTTKLFIFISTNKNDNFMICITKIIHFILTKTQDEYDHVAIRLPSGELYLVV